MLQALVCDAVKTKLTIVSSIEVIRLRHFKLVTVTRHHVFEAKINGTHERK